jgi:hypothetical protein
MEMRGRLMSHYIRGQPERIAFGRMLFESLEMI